MIYALVLKSKKTSTKNPLIGSPESHQSEFENGINTIVWLQLFMAPFENNKTKLLYCYNTIVIGISLTYHSTSFLGSFSCSILLQPLECIVGVPGDQDGFWLLMPFVLLPLN